jgi:ATP-dependent DNA helicase RecG
VEFPIHPDFLPKNIIKEKSSEKSLKKGSEKKSGNISRKASVKGLEEITGSEKSLGKGSGKNLDDSSNKILILIQKTPTLTIRELSEELDISTRAVEKHINSLKKAGKLKRMGSRKEGWWKVV